MKNNEEFKELVMLNAVAPLNKKNKNKIWKNIKIELGLGFIGRIKKVLKLWHSILLILSIGIFTTLAPSANTIIIEADKTGWDVTLDKNTQELFMKAVNPMAVEKNEVCVLWVKKDGQTKMLAHLPDSGSKDIVINKELISLLKNAEVLISIENKNKIDKPNKIEYRMNL